MQNDTAKGGKEVVNLQDTNDGSSALHLAHENVPKHGDSIIEVVKNLESIGGEEILSTLNEDGKNCLRYCNKRNFISRTAENYQTKGMKVSVLLD